MRLAARTDSAWVAVRKTFRRNKPLASLVYCNLTVINSITDKVPESNKHGLVSKGLKIADLQRTESRNLFLAILYFSPSRRSDNFDRHCPRYESRLPYFESLRSHYLACSYIAYGLTVHSCNYYTAQFG